MGAALTRSASLAGAIAALQVAAPAAAQVRSGGATAGSTPSLFPDQGRPYFLTGTVLMEDGSPPPEPVAVERSCGGGRGVPLGFTDADGHFTFGGGSNTAAAMGAQNATAADPFSSGYSDMTGCELRAVATGFSSDAIDLGGRRLLDSPNVGMIVLRRLEGVHGSVFSATTLRAKEEARKAFTKGRELGQRKKYDEAVREYEKAVKVAPGFSAAWFELGLVHQIQGRLDEARKAYRESVAADSEFVKPYRQLAAISFQEHDWPAVLEATERLLWLDPVSYPDAYSYDAVARLYTGNLEKAEASARKAAELDPDGRIPRVRYVLAAILIEKQDYPGAAEALRGYLALAPPGSEADQAKGMLGQVEARLGASPGGSHR